MTTISLKSYVESLLNTERDSSLAIGDGESRAEIMGQLIRDSPDDLDGFAQHLRSSLFLRNISPLLIGDIVRALLVCNPNSIEVICNLLFFLPVCLRPMETYTFCMEAWINLHQESCDHNECRTDCRLGLARSVVACMVTDLITRTDKGPLRRNRMDYLMSFGMQLMSKYFDARPLHSRDPLCNDRMTASLLKVAESAASLHVADTSDIGHSLESEVCIKLLAALVRFRFRAKLNHSNSDIIEFLRRVNSAVINLITTRIQILQTSTHSDDTGGYEVTDNDIASLVVGVPGILPLIWSPTRRSLHMLNACILIIQSGTDFACQTIQQGISVFSNFSDLSNIFPVVAKFFRLSIETATSVGDEDFMTIEERQAVYGAVSDCLLVRSNATHALTACLEIVRETRIDACSGIFIKIAKDVEQKLRTDETRFYAFARSVFAGECVDVINSTDSLKSILNWARWLYLNKRVKRDEKEDVWFGKLLDQLTTQLNNTQQGAEPEQKTRILFIGHLVDRVRELLM